MSKEYINTVTTNNTVESPHFPLYLQVKDNYFNVQLDNNLYLPVSFYEFKTKAQPLEQLKQNKRHYFKQNH